MITIFNRKEVYSTYSMESQARARAALEHHGIDYVICTTAGMARNYGSGPIGTSQKQHSVPHLCEEEGYRSGRRGHRGKIGQIVIKWKFMSCQNWQES